MRTGPDHLVLGIASGNLRFNARIADFRHGADYSYLIDSSVDVVGACGTLFNNQRQLVGVQLFVPSMQQVTVEQPAPADPYTLTLLPIRSLMQFSPARAFGRRIHVRGVVTLSRPGALAFVQDDTGGALIENTAHTHVEPGDLVDGVGFPGTG